MFETCGSSWFAPRFRAVIFQVAAYKARLTSMEFVHGQSLDELQAKKAEARELEEVPRPLGGGVGVQG